VLLRISLKWDIWIYGKVLQEPKAMI
jgi:hypothetical protein